ncbi:hypothetical protein Vi05172_g8940 [Venturia inaequalis]|nr:hypothetical protein Vi05172_g8940 [Venturia inaequalis]
MLPLGLLNAAVGHPMLVELKDGDTLNGHLSSCDTWMNLVLKEVVQTSAEGDKFHRLPEAYVRGNNVRTYLPSHSLTLNSTFLCPFAIPKFIIAAKVLCEVGQRTQRRALHAPQNSSLIRDTTRSNTCASPTKSST